LEKVKIVFLNGTSSSGKTSIAKALQQQLDLPYLHMAVDRFIDMLPSGLEFDQELYWKSFDDLISGFHHSIGALAARGNNMIVDHVLLSGSWLEECLEVLAGCTVFFIGVYCPLDELERRERERGNRAIGLAKKQFRIVHAHGLYDLQLDTSISTVDECATLIRHRISNQSPPQAFLQLQEKKENLQQLMGARWSG
jgi:chloramphenicol 3-O phosphotransferase